MSALQSSSRPTAKRRSLQALLCVTAVLFATHISAVFAHTDSAYSHDAGISYSDPDWMSLVPSDRYLRELSLPGTHDTMSLYGGDIVQTQSMSLATQLNAGIRVLDIRCRRINNAFAIHHGMVYQNANFDDVLATVTQFLNAHPTETVLMRVKEEYDASNSSLSFAEIFTNYVNKPAYNNYFWKSTNTDPKLSDVRGKIVVLRNFSGSNVGLDYNNIKMQDAYNLSTNWDLYDKWTKVKAAIDSANYTTQGSGFYMNYLSGSGGSMPFFVASGHVSNATDGSRLATGLTTPGWNSSYPDFPRVDCFIGICTIAFEGTNTLTANYIANKKPVFVGMVMSDFPGLGLIHKIIALNTAAKAYNDSNYNGAHQSLDVGAHNISNLVIGNDSISSIKLPLGVQTAFLYEHSNFGGKVVAVTSSSTFVSNFNDMTSSAIITSSHPAALFEHGSYAGQEQQFDAGGYPDMRALRIGSDVVSSIMVLPGWKITLYEHINYGGNRKVITATTPYLPDFNDAASSFIIEKL